MRASKFMRIAGLALMATASTFFIAGCESSGGGDGGGNGGGGGGGGGSVVGVWDVNDGHGGLTYWQFNADGTFTYFNDSGLTSPHLRGTYNQNGSKVKGPFTNPGVGAGEIDATVSGSTIAIDFIEHWHTPYKHVPLAGTKR